VAVFAESMKMILVVLVLSFVGTPRILAKRLVSQPLAALAGT
jgi:hypothetical protein